MAAPDSRLLLAIQLGVVVVSLCATGVLLAFYNQPAYSAASWNGVTVSSADWSGIWAPNYTHSPFKIPSLTGPCVTSYDQNTTAQGPANFSGPDFSCFFEANGVVQTANGTGLPGEVHIDSVVAASPFAVVGTTNYTLYPCGNCEVYGVTIELPALPGTYVLNGSVEFEWSYS